MKKLLKAVLVLGIIMVFGGTMWYTIGKSQKKTIEYSTKSPYFTKIVKKSIASGKIVPYKKILIKPRVSGVVEKIYKEPGEKIKIGDVIARVKIIPNMVQLNAAESRVNQAKLNFNDAKINFERNRALFNEKVIPETEFQKAKLILSQQEEEIEAAENNLQLIKEGITSKNNVETNTLIKSTTNGVILDIPIKEGYTVIESNTFNEGTTIATVADLGYMIFLGKIDESEVGKIEKGLPLEIKVGAIDSVKFKGVLTYISPEGVEERGAIQFEVKADVELKEEYFLRAGYSANANIILEQKDHVLAIDEGLIQFDKQTGNSYVNVQVSAEEIKKKYIKTGISDGIYTEIVSGITPDDKVISNLSIQ
jgi:HlyD family secretion protein